MPVTPHTSMSAAAHLAGVLLFTAVSVLPVSHASMAQTLRSEVSRPTDTRAKDLAIVLPAKGTIKIKADSDLFPTTWWQDLYDAYKETSVGSALELENTIADWRLVAVRLAPCQPLLPFVTQRNDQLCQPELRLVWQPVLNQFLRDHWQPYADDRAVHVLYHFDGSGALSAADVKALQDFKARAATLNQSEMVRYDNLNRRVVSDLENRLISLRGKADAILYDDVSERPEFQDERSAQMFIAKLSELLRDLARPERLHQLTSFSLPEGRDPPMIDEWVFVAFEPEAVDGLHLRQQEMTVRSRRDGRILANYGLKARGTARRDDENLSHARDVANDNDRQELDDAVIWTFGERREKRARIADATQTHVAHTSCVSCHKLGHSSFDLHNLSYLQNREISVSPRVIEDVKRELHWLGLKP